MRAGISPSGSQLYAFGPFRLDVGECVLYHGLTPVPLTPKAIDTLIVLVQRHGHLVTKEELMGTVWADVVVEENNLTQNISILRKVLSDTGDGRCYIETVPRRGYRFAAKVDHVQTPAAAQPDAAAAPPDPLPVAAATASIAERTRTSSLVVRSTVALVVGASAIAAAIYTSLNGCRGPALDPLPSNTARLPD